MSTEHSKFVGTKMTNIRDYFPNSHAYNEDDANIIRDFYYDEPVQYYDDEGTFKRKVTEIRKSLYKFRIGREWKERFKEIDTRLNLYTDLFKLHDHDAHPFSRKTILLDIMLDKTQTELESRSKRYFYPGIVLLIMSIFTLFFFLFYLNYVDAINCYISTKSGLLNINPEDIGTLEIEKINKNYVFISSCYGFSVDNPYDFTLLLVKRIVIGGAMLAIAYVFFSLSNACFRESTRLLHRRHSVRYIRLLLYRNDGDLETKDLRDAFGIDDVTTSGFDNIKTDAVLNNLIGRLIDKMGEVKSRADTDKSG